MSGRRRPILSWLPRGPQRIRQDVDEEIRFHLEQRAAELERSGWSPAEARAEAQRRFGDLEETRVICYRSDLRRERHAVRREHLSELLTDLRQGARQLRRNPAFAAAAALTLALGIGGTTAIWSAVDHVLLRPLPYYEPERVVTLWQQDATAPEARIEVAPGNFLAWRERSRSFASLAVADPSGFDLTDRRPPESLPAWRVSVGFLEALGAQPILGRGFAPEDYAESGGKVVLISHALWRERWAADPAIVGRAIQLDFEPVTVVGVLPPWLDYPERRHLWAPKRFTPSEATQSGAGWMYAVGRLRPGIDARQAQAELDGAVRALADDDARSDGVPGVRVVPLEEQILGGVRAAIQALFGAVALLLLIACANVANLLLARGAERATEIGVRAALGAGRARLVRQLTTENVVLAAIGGVLGVGVARAVLQALLALGPSEVPRLQTVGLDARVLAFAGGVTLASTLLFGLAPAVHLAGWGRSDLSRAPGRGATGGRDRARLGASLVVGEIALSLVLLVGAGLLMRSFLVLLDNDPGFRIERRAVLQVFLWDRNPTPQQRRERATAMVERLAAVPGVQSVGVVSALPFHPSQIASQGTLVIEDRPRSGSDADPRVHTTVASPEYFGVMGIPIVAGRGFTAADRAGAPLVALVNETLARQFFPGEDPVGRRSTIGVMSAPASREIVGVVGDVRPESLSSEPRPELYVPFEQSATGSVTFVASTRVDPATVLDALREAVWTVDPDQAIYHASTVSALVAETLSERRFHLLLFAAFSLAALALATLGMYGVVAYATAQRTREIGIRVAMGAGPDDIRRLFLGHGLRMGVAGVVLGTAGALLLTRYLEHMLYGVRATDPVTFLQWSGALLLVTLAGAYLPARRAARADPALALRRGG